MIPVELRIDTRVWPLAHVLGILRKDRLTATDHSDRCVVLAARHQRLAEGLRDLLASVYDRVVVVSDEGSLVEVAARLKPQLAVISLSLGTGDIIGLLRRLRAGSRTWG